MPFDDHDELSVIKIVLPFPFPQRRPLSYLESKLVKSMRPFVLKLKTKKRRMSWFAWAQLIGTFLVPLAIGVYTFIQNHSAQSIALVQRQKDLEIAAENRAKEERIVDNQQKENILVEYLNFLVEWLQNNAIDSNVSESASLVARLKTLAALRQLTPSRRTFLIQSLFEANLITTSEHERGRSIIPLTSAELTGVNLSRRAGVTVRPRYLCPAFEWTIMNNVSFRSAILENARFINAELNFADFTSSIIQSRYNRCPRTMGSFGKSNMYRVIFVNAEIFNMTFTETVMLEANLYGVKCNMCGFLRTKMTHADLRRAEIIGPSFSRQVTLTDSQIDYSTLKEIDFDRGNMERISGRNVTIYNCTFCKSIFNDAILESATIHGSDFSHANMSRAILSHSIMKQINFQSANLSKTDLSHVLCYNCYFHKTDLTSSNLNNASFINCNFLGALVTEEQLALTATLEGSQLFNRTIPL